MPHANDVDKRAEQVYDKENLMKRILFVVVLAAMIVGTTGAASAAPTTRRYFSGGYDICDFVDGTWKWSPSTFQDRGLASTCVTVVPGFPELTGTAYLGAGKWLEVGSPGTSHAIIMGTYELVVGENAEWVGTWVFAPNAGSATMALIGKGKYAGWHGKMIVTQVTDPTDFRTDIIEGYIQYTGK
jgi:hypothetical protein